MVMARVGNSCARAAIDITSAMANVSTTSGPTLIFIASSPSSFLTDQIAGTPPPLRAVP
jgi:hypothetical protein